MHSIPQRSRLDEDTWIAEFNEWAQHSETLVDTLNSDDFKLIIEAASFVNVEYKLMTLASMFKYIDSDDAAITGLTDEIELLELENKYLDDTIGKMIAEFPSISTKLLDEYVLLQKHARRTTNSESEFYAIMTWSCLFPPGCQHLMRVRAVHTRRIENLSAKRDRIASGRDHSNHWSSNMSLIRWDVDKWPHGYGYERSPMPNGLAYFDPPSLTEDNLAQVLSYIRSSAFIRCERRRSALLRLQQDRGGLSDFVVPSHVDAWYHRSFKWLTRTLPILFSTSSPYAAQYNDLRDELKAMHHRWIAEAEYQRPRVLVTKNACFLLSRDKTSIRREVGQFSLPARHTPICIELD
ncbi:unnamed protein product [Aureobasidium uvarum]|uniref:Uncharacterized protein n=1 Tax=Aureobasidium uvarum TaxID=2773716 RepID=A0A9N8KMR3_9PEZI|nr:unnamed protein product [Aureobasidium uvarum]